MELFFFENTPTKIWRGGEIFPKVLITRNFKFFVLLIVKKLHRQLKSCTEEKVKKLRAPEINIFESNS